MTKNMEFDHGGERLRVQVEALASGFRVRVGANDHEVAAQRLPDGRVRFEFEGEFYDAAMAPAGTGSVATRRGDVHVTVGDRSWMLIGTTGVRHRGAREVAGDGVIIAPMTGTVLKILVGAGDEVAAADTVAVVSAMKMEHKLLAGIDGRVIEVAAGEGVTVEQDELILRISP